MAVSRHFTRPVLTAVRDARILGIRAGLAPHRYIGVWVVVVKDRVFVRPWNDKPHGWRQAFLAEARGTMQVGSREIPIRAKPTRSERIMDAVDLAYREKYPTPASRKYVTGFARPRRRATTTELVPR
jgi:hypothetical protein